MARKRYSRRSKSDPIGMIIAIVVLLILAKCVTSGSSKTSRNVKNQVVSATRTPTEIPTKLPTWTPRPTITPYPTNTQSAECQSPDCGCVIKGNINSDGKKIYHCPNSPNYDDVRLNKYGERYFCTEADAIAAGFTRTENTSYCGGL